MDLEPKNALRKQHAAKAKIFRSSNYHKDKPLLNFLRKIIDQDVTILDNELIKILRTEFRINIPRCHRSIMDLKSDIYLSVLKKFMKCWPQWPYFQIVMNSRKDDRYKFETMLESQYKSFREYLLAMLKACEPLAEEAVQQAPTLTRKNGFEKVEDTASVVLEIISSRDQLNRLFFRKPHPDFNGSIFNVDHKVPSKILGTLSLKSILNWWHINTIVSLECFKYKREITHELKHVLINDNLKHAKKVCLLKTNLQVKETKTLTSVTKASLIALIDKIIEINTRRYADHRENIQIIFSVIQEDIRLLADVVNVPSSFRYFMNERPYLRYLYEDVESSIHNISNKYDLKLEEALSPRLALNFTAVSMNSLPNIQGNNWLMMACVLCRIRFVGFSGIEALIQHYNEVHIYEPDFSCTNCGQTFTVNVLASTRWHHRCL